MAELWEHDLRLMNETWKDLQGCSNLSSSNLSSKRSNLLINEVDIIYIKGMTILSNAHDQVSETPFREEL